MAAEGNRPRDPRLGDLREVAVGVGDRVDGGGDVDAVGEQPPRLGQVFGTLDAEGAGDAAVLVDPRDTAGIADALVRVASDRRLADDLRRRGRERAAGFSWARTAGDYVDLYRRLAAG